MGNETSVIPEGIENIAPYAFYDNNNVTTMVIPSSVKTIGDYAFYGCRNMNDIKLGSNIDSIGDYAFMYCINIKTDNFGPVSYNSICLFHSRSYVNLPFSFYSCI